MKTKIVLKKNIFLLFLFMLLLSFNNTVYAVVLDKEAQKQPEYAPDEIIVKLKSGPTYQTLSTLQKNTVNTDKLSNLKSKYNLRDEKQLFKKTANKSAVLTKQAQSQSLSKKQAVDLSSIYLLKTDKDVLKTCATLKQDPDVEYAEPNYIVKAQMIPNDPYYVSSGNWGQPYDDLWGIKKIQCEQAWDISHGEGVVVAVIDTGVDYNHPDIAANIWTNPNEIPNNGIDDDSNGYVDDIRGWDFAYNDNDPMDGYGHGTHVAGTIAAIGNNSIGVIGVAPRARIMGIKGLNDDGEGTNANLANCIIYAADNGAKVLSNSWGGIGSSQILIDAFYYADAAGCVSLAAAGNNNSDVSSFQPANINTVIAVAATTQNDEKCSFSNYGNKIDVSAPGGGYEKELGNGPEDIYNILSTMSDTTSIATGNPLLKVGSGYWRLAGTSMACPHVAGVAALILSRHPEFTNQKIRQAIRASSDDIGLPGFDIYSGYGRLNAYKASQIQTVPEVHIVYPVNEQKFGIGRVDIAGIAEGKYILEYKNTTADNWILISSGANVINSNLGTLAIDANNFSIGSYLIRLTVNEGGYDFVDVISIWINTRYNIEEIQITTNPGNQNYPAIYGDKIAWTDNRNGNNDIYMYDLSTHQETQITTDPFYQEMPTINGGRIAWLDLGDKISNLNGDVYIYDLSTQQEIYIDANAAATLTSPAIYGNKIVWEDNRNWNNSGLDIYMYDLSTSQETFITTNSASQRHPGIYDNKIVYADDRNGNSDIYMYDLSTHQETQITTDPNDQQEPAIWGDKIVWSDARHGNSDIYMYNLSTHQEMQITSNPSDQLEPAIWENKIVWSDGRKWNYNNGNYNIYMYDLSAHVESWVTTNTAMQCQPAIYGDKIVWTDLRNGNRDIYMATVTPIITNQPPVLGPIGDKTIDEGQTLTFTISAADPDGDSLTYSANNLPPGATFNPGTRTFTWTPTYDQAGTHNNIHFEVTDGSASASEDITITVNNVNCPPVLNPIGNKEVKENEKLEFTISASDPDNDQLMFWVSSNLPNAALEKDGTFTSTLSYNDAGSYNATFTVSDGDLTAEETITITVVNVNRPPVLDPIGNKVVSEGSLLQFTVYARDPDHDLITYSADNLPKGAIINSKIGQFNWTPDYRQAGNYTITFIASDGSLIDKKVITIKVNNVPIPDLTTGAITYTVTRNGVCTFRTPIKNIGDRAITTPFYVYFYVDGKVKGSIILRYLVPGQTITSSFPWTAVKGIHVIKITADATGRIKESDENNNSAQIKIVVK